MSDEDPTFNYIFPRDGRFIDRSKMYLLDDSEYIYPHIREWLTENCTNPWFYCGLTHNLFFESSADGAFFRLRWL